MIPKERAISLVEEFKFETTESEMINKIVLGDLSVKFKQYKAKECALITIKYCKETAKYMPETLSYWQKVEEELNLLPDYE
jgi:hypothetical protein